MPDPYSAIPGLVSGLGDMFGGIAAGGALQTAGKHAAADIERANSVLNSGIAATDTAYNPYTTTGSGVLPQLSSDIAGSGGIAAPQESAQFAFDQWRDPSANYVRDQALAGIQAGSVAGGRLSSGTVKNLESNAAQLGNTAYSTAYNKYLGDSELHFGQQQTQYQDANQQEQQRIANESNLAGMGLQATNANQSTNAGYRQGISGNYVDLANTEANIGGAQAGSMRNMFSGVGTGLSRGLASYFTPPTTK